MPAVAALHAHFQRGFGIDNQLESMPPWEFTTITSNKTTMLLRSDKSSTIDERSNHRGPMC